MKRLDVLTVPLGGTHLVEASAGTGKTFAITALVLRLLIERRLPLEQILVVTFTRAATAELKQRIRRRVQEAAAAFADPGASKDEFLTGLARASRDLAEDRRRLEQAVLAADQASVMTIHGFCQRVLQENAFETGTPFGVELVSDVRPMLRELVEDWWARTFAEVSSAELDYAAEKGFTLAAAETLAAAAVALPDMVVVAAPAPPVAASEALQHYHELRRRVATVWRESRRSVMDQLFSSNALHGGKYRRDYLEKWLAELEALLEPEHETFDGWFEMFAKFTPESLAAGTKKGGQPPSHPFFAYCQELLDARHVADSALEYLLQQRKCDLASWVRTELGKRKAEDCVQTFDDLLGELSRALRGARGRTLSECLARQYRAALIDEFQDTDPVQYEIFRRIYRDAEASLFLVGDPKQAIYAFRGADIFAYLRAVRDTPDEHRWTMAINWRSDPGLITAVNTIFGSCERPFLLHGIDFHEVAAREGARNELTIDAQPAAPLEILYVSAESAGAPRQRLTKVDFGGEQLPLLVATDIRRLLAADARVAGRAVQAADIAILTRTNQQASDMQHELRRFGIPSVLGGDASVLDSAEARALLAVMQAMERPGSDDWLWTALASAPLGLCAEEVACARGDVVVWEQWEERFSGWHAAWQRFGFMRAFRQLSKDLGVPRRLLTRVGGERALTNWLHLAELLHQVASTKRLGMPALIDWFEQVQQDQDARREIGSEDQQIRLESDASAVQLVTMHRSKGLEYPVVYCPYLWEAAALRPDEIRHVLYHDPADGQRLKLDIRTKGEKSAELDQAKDERLAEYLRLTYVALTRARHQCRLVWGLFTGVESSPLAHLLHTGFRGRHGESGPEKLDETRMREQLAALAREAGGTIGIRELVPSSADPLQHADSMPEIAGPRVLERTLQRTFRTSSFSALTSDHEMVARTQGVVRDRDDVARGQRQPPPGDTPQAPASNLAGFPRGARSGELLHAILENVDFAALDGREPSTETALVSGTDGLEQVARVQMGLHGFAYAEWGDTVCQCIRAVLAAPLDDDGRIRLELVTRARRLSELEFVLPVPSRAAQGLTAAALGEAFAASAVDPVVRDYSAAVSRLEFAPLTGFLRGFIDLVFEFEGRWYVVDYKSNDLGETAAHYEREALVESMVSHHYILQYHLYVLALHRYLQHRLSGYAYEKDFGGVYYLFLRGVGADPRRRTGVWFDRPPFDLIERLLSALEAEGASPRMLDLNRRQVAGVTAGQGNR